MPKDVLEKLIIAADQHGVDSLIPHTVGDLQHLLRAAWKQMNMGQKHAFLLSESVQDVVESGAREEFSTKTLTQALKQVTDRQLKEVTDAGFRIMQNERGFFWETDDEMGEVWVGFADAVEDAHQVLQEHNRHTDWNWDDVYELLPDPAELARAASSDRPS